MIAKELRVSVRSVERWRRSWREGGRQALRASGPAKRLKVSDDDFAVLEPLLLKGAMAQGWADERWTLSRVRMLIADYLGASLSIRGVWELLRRHGWSSEACPTGSRTGRGGGGQLGEGDLAPGKATAAALGAWLVFEDEAPSR
ncbi:winged helix-turn-helix domain-containing protein [Streptomyces sp. NPDC052016]|uniref:winged helix-turn-helix domain-containing protein n=1 Tax=Streptomyces sp. NPDC052016 TaxID=3365680 RepID=UPI0037D4F160